jgi:hypothetical protein
MHSNVVLGKEILVEESAPEYEKLQHYINEDALAYSV